jgi:hypothetical protein
VNPIAYTYEADYHCEDCAYERFGKDEHGDITGIDNEGNEIGAVFSWDGWYANTAYEWAQGEHTRDAVLICGTCFYDIARVEYDVEGR